MSRKFDRQFQINKKVVEILEDPNTVMYLGSRLIRKKPKIMPRFAWKALLSIVLAPPAKEIDVASRI